MDRYAKLQSTPSAEHGPSSSTRSNVPPEKPRMSRRRGSSSRDAALSTYSQAQPTEASAIRRREEETSMAAARTICLGDLRSVGVLHSDKSLVESIASGTTQLAPSMCIRSASWTILRRERSTATRSPLLCMRPAMCAVFPPGAAQRSMIASPSAVSPHSTCATAAEGKFC